MSDNKKRVEDLGKIRDNEYIRRIYWSYMFIFFVVLVALSALFESTSNQRIFAALWVIWGLSWILIIFYPWYPRRYWRRYYRYRYFADEPEEELKLRFARGEISKKEFEDRIKELEKYRY